MTPEILTRSYEDLSTDAGFRFRFHCERCDRPYVSRFQPAPLDADHPLDPVGALLADAQHATSAEEIAQGRPGHDSALRTAIAEVAEHFHECPRCGEWVCGECWNRAMLLCQKCAPGSAGTSPETPRYACGS